MTETTGKEPSAQLKNQLLRKRVRADRLKRAEAEARNLVEDMMKDRNGQMIGQDMPGMLDGEGQQGRPADSPGVQFLRELAESAKAENEKNKSAQSLARATASGFLLGLVLGIVGTAIAGVFA